MTRTLVITVDRDNDLGLKTSIRGPVVGRRQVLTAALKLGIADPEESDTNAILGALSVNDKLVDSKSEEDDVEIAILTGDEKVGVRSDRAIAAQLDEVVSAFQPDQAVLVTDGAEDESVLPIITSQVRIDHVEKIIVRQSKGIEGTYYYIVKALEDPKWRSRIMIPFGAVLAIFGLGIMLPNEIGGIVIGALPLPSVSTFSARAPASNRRSTVSSKRCEKTPMRPCSRPCCGRPRCSVPFSLSLRGGERLAWPKARPILNPCCG